MLKCFTAAALVFGLVLPTASARAAEPGFCKHYAQLAVAQYQRSRQGCFQGTNRGWHAKLHVHYNWCLGVPEDAARQEDASRGAALHRCFD